jgi:hypothetical protein
MVACVAPGCTPLAPPDDFGPLMPETEGGAREKRALRLAIRLLTPLNRFPPSDAIQKRRLRQ